MSIIRHLIWENHSRTFPNLLLDLDSRENNSIHVVFATNECVTRPRWITYFWISHYIPRIANLLSTPPSFPSRILPSPYSPPVPVSILPGPPRPSISSFSTFVSLDSRLQGRDRDPETQAGAEADAEAGIKSSPNQKHKANTEIRFEAEIEAEIPSNRFNHRHHMTPYSGILISSDQDSKRDLLFQRHLDPKNTHIQNRVKVEIEINAEIPSNLFNTFYLINIFNYITDFKSPDIRWSSISSPKTSRTISSKPQTYAL